MIAKLIRTQCRKKDLADTAVVDPTVRPVVTAGNLPEEAAIRRVEEAAIRRVEEAAIRRVEEAAIRRAEEHHLVDTVRPAIHRRAGHLPATVQRSPATAGTPARLPVPRARRRTKTRPCFGSASAAVACCCSAQPAGSRRTCTCAAKSRR